MHDVTILWVASEYVRDNLAEGLRKDTLVDVFDSSMDVFLCGRDATLHITVVHIRILLLEHSERQHRPGTCPWC